MIVIFIYSFGSGKSYKMTTISLNFFIQNGKKFKRLAYYSFNWFQIEIPSLSHGPTITNIGIKTLS